MLEMSNLLNKSGNISDKLLNRKFCDNMENLIEKNMKVIIKICAYLNCCKTKICEFQI